ncbi:MAG TPA: hypothetical protein VJH95_04815 [Candidatus Nanoarchaeia archaeon]|nr:hypothetical protein [Candidatus Nanoarchaeia archaeon]
MNKKFNIFSLHDDVLDRHPRSWICIKSQNLEKIVFNLESEILKNRNLTRESLSREMGLCFNCSHGMIKQLFQGKKAYYPIPFLLYLLGKTGNLSLLKSLQITSLKVNSASSLSLKLPSKLNRTLAKILGAFMADGSFTLNVRFASYQKSDLDILSKKLAFLGIKFSESYVVSRKEFQMGIVVNKKNLKLLKQQIFPYFSSLSIQSKYTLELTDEHRDNVQAFAKWLFDEFGVTSLVLRHSRKNAWRVIYSNKIIARYLMAFFEVSPGPKTYTAFEPRLIRESTLFVRREFAKGVLMFDGHVTQFGTISFSTVSKNLHDAIKDIWSLDGLTHFSCLDNRGSYILATKRNNPISKTKSYFEEGTTKENRLQWVVGKYGNDPIPVKENSKVSFPKLMDVIMCVEVCDTFYLSSLFHCTTSTLREYLNVLYRQNKIYLSRTPQLMRLDTFSPKTTILLRREVHDLMFKKIKSRFSTYYKFAKLLDLKKGTFSAMKVRKSRIPLLVLSKMIALLDIDKNLVLNNIERIDREAILINNSA